LDVDLRPKKRVVGGKLEDVSVVVKVTVPVRTGRWTTRLIRWEYRWVDELAKSEQISQHVKRR
jgi:hypothetical protein